MPESDRDNLAPPIGPIGPRPAGSPARPLTPPGPVAAVPVDRAAGLVPLDRDVQAQLEARAQAFADELVAADPRSPEFARRVSSIATMGEADLRASTRVSSHLLRRPDSPDATGRVAAMLDELRRTVTDLDPARVELSPAGGVRRLLPGGDRLRRYFDRYRSAQARLDDVIRALVTGQDELRRDNAAIDTERAEARAAMEKLSEYAALGAALDEAVTARAGELDARGRSDAAGLLRSEALVAVRQRRQDMLTQLAVSTQGHLALDVVRRNNIELIKGVERARTATIGALRAAVAAAHALAGEQLVLDRIGALDTAAAAALRPGPSGRGSGEVGAGDLASLRLAFEDLFAAIDAVDRYQSEARTNLAATVGPLDQQAGRARAPDEGP